MEEPLQLVWVGPVRGSEYITCNPWSRRRARIIVQGEDEGRKMWGEKLKKFYQCVLKPMMQPPKAVTCRIDELVQAETCAETYMDLDQLTDHASCLSNNPPIQILLESHPSYAAPHCIIRAHPEYHASSPTFFSEPISLLLATRLEASSPSICSRLWPIILEPQIAPMQIADT